MTGFSSHRYNTRSNKVRVVKTPGGKLRYLHIKKRGSPPKCGDCGVKLPGVSPRFFYEFLVGNLGWVWVDGGSMTEFGAGWN